MTVAAPQVRAPRSPGRHAGRRSRHRLRRDWQLLLMIAAGGGAAAGLPLPAGARATWSPSRTTTPYLGDHAAASGSASAELPALFAEPALLGRVANTLSITAFQLVFFFPLPIALALMLNSSLSATAPALRPDVVYLPHFFSWVLVVTLFQQLLGGAGLLAQTCATTGSQAVDLMTNPDTFLLLVTAQPVWKDAGWGMIIFLAALATIDPPLRGRRGGRRRRWRRLWHITLPGLRPVIVLLLILRLGDILNVGFEQFILQRDAVGGGAAEVLDTFTYYAGVVAGDWSYGAAAGLFKGVVGLVADPGGQQVRPPLGEQGIYSEAHDVATSLSGKRSRPRSAGWSRRCPGAVALVVAVPCTSVVVTSLSSPEAVTRAGGLVVVPRELDVRGVRAAVLRRPDEPGAPGQRRRHRRRHGVQPGGHHAGGVRAVAAGSLLHRPLLLIVLFTFLFAPGHHPDVPGGERARAARQLLVADPAERRHRRSTSS